jgi:hypothetical protein
MKYFNDCQNLDEAKNLFKTLVFKLHPDTSGYDSQSDFIIMHAEFKKLAKSLKFKTGKDQDQDFDEENFYDVLRKFDGLDGVIIEVIGTHIWLSNTKYHQKTQIMAIRILNYKSAIWAGKKKAFWIRPEDYVSTSRKEQSLETLKNVHGCKSFTAKKGKYLAA